MDKFLETNKKYWNESVEKHKISALYDIESFKNGENALHSLEIDELGDISEKSLLHLQCHFGMDTLSLAMLGAKVTGVDYSETAIDEAKKLSEELKIPAEFVHSDINSLTGDINSKYKSDELLSLRDKKFDIVFTSYGILGWLPDINKWAEVVNHYLKPGGFFYIVEVHPASQLYEYSEETKSFELRYPYFHSKDPLEFHNGKDYTSDEEFQNKKTFEWVHNISDIIMSLLNKGLKLEFFHEHNYTGYKQYSNMKQDEDGYFRFIDKNINLPLLFSLKASKPT